MIKNYFSGNLKEATATQLNSIELIDALFCEVNPIPVKAALNLMGYNFGEPRLPLTPISSSNLIKLQTAMAPYLN